jgi:hypothetical protein
VVAVNADVPPIEGSFARGVPHGYIVQFRGVTERAAINKEYEGMLARLCKIKEWCLPSKTQ